MSLESPQTRDHLLRALEQQERKSAAYWSAFDTDAFFRRIGESWSPSEAVRHLNKSTRPVAKALRMPWLVLRFMFGKASRPSMTYDALVERYRTALAAGGEAGRFAPSVQSRSDAEEWRASIMRDYANVHRELRAAIARWPDARLDRLQLPHPLLGKLTVREMLFFTLYHQRHHVAVVERRLHEQA
ncbi:MAG TPA: DinB family protein [Thermoanaerobaculia bacterium]|nr:DinB family protein [Thermoanaerobaculia bacterium]